MKFAAFLYSDDINALEEVEDDFNKYRLGMLCAVIFSVSALIVKLVSIIIPTMDSAVVTTN